MAWDDIRLSRLRPGPGVRYGRADLGSSLFLVSCSTPTQDKTTLVEFSSVATNPTQKLRFLARVCSPREARPTLLDYPVYLKPFCKSQQSHHPRTSHVSHNYHNFGIGAKKHPTRKGQDTGDQTWFQLVSHQSSPCQFQQMVARQLKLQEGLIKPGSLDQGACRPRSAHGPTDESNCK